MKVKDTHIDLLVVFTAIYVGAEIKAAVQSGALTSLLWILLPAAAVSLRKYVTAKRVEALRILGALSVSVSAMSVVFDAFDAAPQRRKVSFASGDSDGRSERCRSRAGSFA